VSRSLSHNARISFVAPSPFEIASCRTPSLKEDKTLKHGITTSSRCAYRSCSGDGRFDCGGVQLTFTEVVPSWDSWPHPSSDGSPSPSPNILSMPPTHCATRSTTPTSTSFARELIYTLVRETRSRKTLTALGVSKESQRASRNLSWA
jgi:hypothetical protein